MRSCGAMVQAGGMPALPFGGDDGAYQVNGRKSTVGLPVKELTKNSNDRRQLLQLSNINGEPRVGEAWDDWTGWLDPAAAERWVAGDWGAAMSKLCSP